MPKEKLPQLAAILDSDELAHIQAFPSLLRVVIDHSAWAGRVPRRKDFYQPALAGGGKSRPEPPERLALPPSQRLYLPSSSLPSGAGARSPNSPS